MTGECWASATLGPAQRRAFHLALAFSLAAPHRAHQPPMVSASGEIPPAGRRPRLGLCKVGSGAGARVCVCALCSSPSIHKVVGCELQLWRLPSTVRGECVYPCLVNRKGLYFLHHWFVIIKASYTVLCESASGICFSHFI